MSETGRKGAVELTLLHVADDAPGKDANIDLDLGFGAKGDKPVKGVDYWTAKDRSDMARDIRRALEYNASYKLDQAQLPMQIEGENLQYDEIQGMWRVIGELRIAVPNKSDYYLSINIGQRFDEGTIEVAGKKYQIIDSMLILLEDVEEISFKTDIYIWLESISVHGMRPMKIPTKVSELKNDLGFASGEVNGETLTFK